MATGGHSWFWVAEYEGAIIAAAMVAYDGHRGTVNYLGLDPDCLHSGVGRLMMAQLEADF